MRKFKADKHTSIVSLSKKKGFIVSNVSSQFVNLFGVQMTANHYSRATAGVKPTKQLTKYSYSNTADWNI